MSKLKLFLESEYLYQYKDIHVIGTKHQIKRTKERVSSKEDTEDLFKKTIVWLKDNGTQHKKYVFISKSTNLAMAVDYRPDKNHQDKGNQVILITFFGDIRKLPTPKTPQSFKMKFQSDKKVIVEQLKNICDEIDDIDEIVEV